MESHERGDFIDVVLEDHDFLTFDIVLDILDFLNSLLFLNERVFDSLLEGLIEPLDFDVSYD